MKAKNFIQQLFDIGYERYFGVPDSLLSSLSKSLDFDFDKIANLIASNEGSALSMAMGYNLSTNKFPVIYLQNSGIGNLINPYNSLLNENIYKIPFLLLIGWRGEPGVQDEPQHIFQGKTTLDQLELMDIEYSIIANDDDYKEALIKLQKNNSRNKPYAFVIKKQFFSEDKRLFNERNTDLKRKDALKAVLKTFGEKTIYVSTTGKLSRELYEYRKDTDSNNDDLYLVGGMGHTFSIAFSIAYENPEKLIVCLDGDGSILMHLGSIGLLSKYSLKNFVHIAFNNSSHQSVGGQPNYFDSLDIKNLFMSLGYKSYFNFKDVSEIQNFDLKSEKPVFINIEVNNYSDPNLIRPSSTPLENKKNFIKKLQK